MINIVNYIIKEITELDGLTPKLSHLHRVGREGSVTTLKINEPMYFYYKDYRKLLLTSYITKVEEDEKFTIVTTENSIYKLQKID